jgi:Na+/melibiose symporter-like transporter
LVVWVFGVVAVAGFGLFLVLERRGPTPMVPLSLFRNRQFLAANGVTLLAYAALGVYFLLVVLQLQVVLGWSPMAAGASTIPVTALTLVLSRPSGALAQRIGPRVQMTVGPLLCGAATILTARLGPDATYWTAVFPIMVVFGLGLATMVAPLTSAALGSLPDSRAGLASGVNNAVARTGSLLAIAGIPVVAGLTGNAMNDRDAFAAGFGTAMIICGCLFAAAGVLALLAVRRPGGGTPSHRHSFVPSPGAAHPMPCPSQAARNIAG